MTPVNKGREGEPMEILARGLVTEAPRNCPYKARHKLTKEEAPMDSLVILLIK